MFKSARWRSEKNKIKVVFKLQFHATQVPQVGGDSLTISLVPADVGKPTVKSEKAAIRDGSCHWENPVYETVKFFRETKTGKIHEKIYNLVVSTGSSKSGLIGEASIDFASYAESIKPSSVSLPLKNAKYNAVSIQRMHENIDQREPEEIGNTKNNSNDRTFKTQLGIGDANVSIKSNSTEDGLLKKNISNIADSKGTHRASSGSDLTMSSSESSSGLNTPREFGLENNNGHHDSVIQKTTSDLSTTNHEEHPRSQWEWLGGSAREASTDDSSSSSRDALLKEKSEEASEIVIKRLRTELDALSRQAEVSELELQTLRKQIVKESKRGQDLFREVVSLKEERESLTEECRNLKAFQKRMDEAKFRNKSNFEGADPRAHVEELRQELNYEKNLNANLQLQLQKIQESNSELILAVRDLDEMLEQKNREIVKLSSRSATSENLDDLQETRSKSEMEDDEEQKALEELVKDHSDSEEAQVLEQKITDLYNELEIYRRERDELEVQMEQLALDYEILKQENHELSYRLEQSQVQEQLKMQYECSSSYATVNELEAHIENLECELKNQSKEFSDSLATITKLETHVKSLEEELEKQAQGFEADLEILTSAKVEQEHRAIRAEEAFRKMRWQNANTAERLQEEFRRLSVQMSSTFEENEKLAMKALTEASQLRLQKCHLEELLRKANEELESARDQYEAKLQELSGQRYFKINQIEQLQSEMEIKSKEVERQKTNDEESRRLLSQEILILKAEIERLKADNSNLSIEAEKRETFRGELERMNTSMKETEMLLERGNVERNEMESAIALLRKEVEKSTEELNVLRNLKDDKESVIGNLRSELEAAKSQYNEMKNSLRQDEFEKEKLRKEVFQLKGDLKKKEDVFSSLEKKLKDTNNWLMVLDGAKTTSRNNKSSVPRGPKEIVNLKDTIKLLKGQIKLKEVALETSTNLFLEKEKDLQNKIEELESRLEEISQTSASFYESEYQKAFKNSDHITSNDSIHEDVKNTVENLRNTSCMCNENVAAMPLMPLMGSEQGNIEELVNEMVLLKERNKSMEEELKEMQDRYSEISLKFAEVEGERQQLVMTLRSLKNPKRS
ncbi:myosin heavy chain-related protein [Actinidia rufa]|uniref:Myosin heavy chain-related protein n=1 Tax=Actinidia rufa TaxID=165716 RepID=A0A7J0H075_9ERIC|nr:myosin heavy chain-related protein [Actinidia rufa]